MIINILEYLENSACEYPDKIAFVDSENEVTFSQLMYKAKAIASSIIKMKKINHPVAIYMPKGVNCIISFMAVAYSGNFYTPIDYEMPVQRIKSIINILQPIAIITDRASLSSVKDFSSSDAIFVLEDILETKLMIML